MKKTDKREIDNQDISFLTEVSEWNKNFAGFSAVEWERLPDIELYMDQVVTFLDRQMKIYRRDDKEKVITPSMINNYTKDHVIPRAESKKYSRDHIALIMVLCSLKKVLSMPDLSNLLKDFKVNEGDSVEKFYELFREYQAQALKNTSDIISESLSENTNETAVLKNLALRLAVEAQAKCAAAEQILSILDTQ